MKKIIAWVVVCMAVALGISACGGGGASGGGLPTASDIVGTWKCMSLNGADVSADNLLFLFKTDSTYDYTNDKVPCSETGSWILIKDQLTMAPSGSTCNALTPYSTTIGSYSGNSVTVSGGGKTAVYQRQSFGGGYAGTYSGTYSVSSPLGFASGNTGTLTVDANGNLSDVDGFFTGTVDKNGNFTGNWDYSAGSLPIPMTGVFKTTGNFTLSGTISTTVSGSMTLHKF